jgi:hypothetical protein
MTPLKKWKKEQGLTYKGIRSRLGGKWKREHLVNVFNGNGVPGPFLLVSLEALTGLSTREILVNFKLPGNDHDRT